MPRKSVTAEHYLKLYDEAMVRLNEAESNILDAYEGTSAAAGIKRSYSAKRGKLARMKREAGL